MTFRKLLAYFGLLDLEPIPFLQTVAHAEYVFRHKKYFSFREDSRRYDCYATCKPKLRKFMEKWIDERLRLFHYVKYFHLGGDEGYVFATVPLCVREAKTIAKGKLYAEYMKEIVAPLIQNGIRPGISGDVALKHLDPFEVLLENFLIWGWNYWDTDTAPWKLMLWNQGRMVTADQVTPEDRRPFPRIIECQGNFRPLYTADYLKQLGYDVMLSSPARSHGDGVFASRENAHASNIVVAVKKVVEDSLLGTCVTRCAVQILNCETHEAWSNLAPLTVVNSFLTDEQLVARSTEYVFRNSSSKIVHALVDIGHCFPFVSGNTTGMTWTGMKDSRSAPLGYIDSLVGSWKKAGDVARKDKVRTIDSVGKKIKRGIDELDDFIPSGTKGFDAIYSRSKAAYFRYWGCVIANDIVRNENDDLHSKRRIVIALLKGFKSDYIDRAKSWMTPAPSNENAILIYDALIDYFCNVTRRRMRVN